MQFLTLESHGAFWIRDHIFTTPTRKGIGGLEICLVSVNFVVFKQ